MVGLVPKYKVLHVINRVGTSGGAEHSLLLNLRHFSDPEFEHHVAALFPHQSEPRGVQEVEEVATYWPLLHETRASHHSNWRDLRRLVRRLKPSLIHCSLAEASLASRIVGFATGVPVVESLVNISHERVRAETSTAVTPLKLFAHRAIDWASMRAVARFHALSRAVAESWVRTVGIPESKITVIPRAIELDRLQQQAAAGPSRSQFLSDLGLPPDAKLIVNVGRQEPQKGQIHLLRAAPRILAEVPNAAFVIAGREGNASKDLEETAEALGVVNRVFLLGNRPDVPALLAAADLFVFPSEFEGLGVALLEAMAMGVPVAVTNRPPMNELVADGVNGRLFDLDPESVAETLLDLLYEPRRAAALGEEAARSIATGRYSPDNVAQAMESLYRAALRKEEPV